MYTAFDIVGALSLGGFVIWTYMKITSLEHSVDDYPTPVELAKEIVNIKLPLSDVPPEVLAQMKAQEGNMAPPFVAPPSNKRPKKVLHSYIG